MIIISQKKIFKCDFVIKGFKNINIRKNSLEQVVIVILQKLFTIFHTKSIELFLNFDMQCNKMLCIAVGIITIFNL